MAIITDAAPVAAGSLLVDIDTLEFNRDRTAKVHTLDGWWDTVTLDVDMVSNGGVGAVPTGPWLPKERYLTVAGHTLGVDPFAMRRLLLAAFSPDADTPVTVTYPDGATERLWVRPFDRFELVPKGNQLRFTLPLVAMDPWKYTAQPLTGEVGVFTGQTWYREYDPVTFTRSYALTGGRWNRSYQQAEATGPYPPSLTLTSGGDRASSRMTANVTGPLAAGDWWLLEESSGRRLWADVAIAEGQSLVFDMAARTARLNGAAVDHLVFGDWLTLAPGQNVFRLVSGTQSDAHASLEASEASQ
jgi:hypothetical protein